MSFHALRRLRQTIKSTVNVEPYLSPFSGTNWQDSQPLKGWHFESAFLRLVVHRLIGHAPISGRIHANDSIPPINLSTSTVLDHGGKLPRVFSYESLSSEREATVLSTMEELKGHMLTLSYREGDLKNVVEVLKKTNPAVNENFFQGLATMLLQFGASKAEILNVFQTVPGMWRTRPNPSRFPLIICVLQSHGFSFDEAAQAVISKPILLLPNYKHVDMILSYLRSILNVKQIKKLVHASPQTLTLSQQNLQLKVTELQGMGLHEIGCTVARWPHLLNQKQETVQIKAQALRRMLQIDDIGGLVERSPHLLGMRAETQKITFEGLVEVFGQHDATQMILLQPALLTRKWIVLREKIDYTFKLLPDEGRELLKQWPTALTYGLESRIKPRMMYAKKNNILPPLISFNAMLSLPEDRFLEMCAKVQKKLNQ